MLDIKFIRSNPELVKQAVHNRNGNLDKEIDELLEIDVKRRELIAKTESLKAQQNTDSKKIPQIKKEGGDASAIMAEMKEISAKIKQLDSELNALNDEQQRIVYMIPNVPNKDVPIGTDDSMNKEIRRSGEPTAFEYEPKAHWDLGASLDILDPETAAKVTGARFHFYKGLGARLERSIISFFLDTHTAHGYTEILPPFMVNRASMTGTGQLPKFEEDAFKLTNDYFLIPTAEVPVTNMHRDEILDGSKLPIKYCA